MGLQLLFTVIAALLGLAATVTSSLVLFTLNRMTKRQDDFEERLHAMEGHRQECLQHFVSAEDFIRNQTYTRDKLDRISISIAELAVTLKSNEKLPELVGAVVRTCLQEISKNAA